MVEEKERMDALAKTMAVELKSLCDQAAVIDKWWRKFAGAAVDTAFNAALIALVEAPEIQTLKSLGWEISAGVRGEQIKAQAAEAAKHKLGG
jgi:hypothetical protein